MPKLIEPICRACYDTKRNSNGGDCYPCLRNGRIALVEVWPVETQSVVSKPERTVADILGKSRQPDCERTLFDA